MKKEVISKLVFLFMLSIFLLSGISAVPRDECAIVDRESCTGDSTKGYIVMRLSSESNAHGELVSEENYDSVLCCNIGTGNTNCNPEGDPDNKIIGLSSSTNAHAEIPSANNYGTDVCYEDFNCIGTSSDCGVGGALDYPFGILSLSSTTNAHIGPYEGIGSYPTKICCGGSSITARTCFLKSASWNRENAEEGQSIKLEVIGSGAECNNVSLSFNVTEGGAISQGDASTQPSNVAFNGDKATSVWYAEWEDYGILEGDPEYYFIATIKGTSKTIESSDPKLSVTQQIQGVMNTCEDYEEELDCESYSPSVAENSGEGIVDCGDENIECLCVWDDETGCDFGSIEITQDLCGNPTDGCNYGCTLCNNEITGNYCNLGAICPTGETPGDNDGICESGIDGCSSEDCEDGDQDTCSSDTYCVLGKCSSVEGPPPSFGMCKITQVVESSCDEIPMKFRTLKIIGTWTGEECGPACEKCKALEDKLITIPCAAQIQLPFFGNYSIIIIAVLIALIYMFLKFKEKEKSSKRKVKKK